MAIISNLSLIHTIFTNARDLHLTLYINFVYETCANSYFIAKNLNL